MTIGDHKYAETDPRFHTTAIHHGLAKLIASIGKHLDEVEEPNAHALLATTADTLTELAETFTHYEHHGYSHTEHHTGEHRLAADMDLEEEKTTADHHAAQPPSRSHRR